MEKTLHSVESIIRLWILMREKKSPVAFFSAPSSKPRVDCSVVHDPAQKKAEDRE